MTKTSTNCCSSQPITTRNDKQSGHRSPIQGDRLGHQYRSHCEPRFPAWSTAFDSNARRTTAQVASTRFLYARAAESLSRITVTVNLIASGFTAAGWSDRASFIHDPLIFSQVCVRCWPVCAKPATVYSPPRRFCVVVPNLAKTSGSNNTIQYVNTQLVV